MSPRCGSNGWRRCPTSTTSPSSAVDCSTASIAALLARPQRSFEPAALNCGYTRAARQAPCRLWPPGWGQWDSGITFTCPGHGYVIWPSFQFNMGTYMGVIGILWFVLQLCLKWSFHVLMARTLGDLCEMFFNVYSIRENQDQICCPQLYRASDDIAADLMNAATEFSIGNLGSILDCCVWALSLWSVLYSVASIGCPQTYRIGHRVFGQTWTTISWDSLLYNTTYDDTYLSLVSWEGSRRRLGLPSSCIAQRMFRLWVL